MGYNHDSETVEIREVNRENAEKERQVAVQRAIDAISEPGTEFIVFTYKNNNGSCICVGGINVLTVANNQLDCINKQILKDAAPKRESFTKTNLSSLN